MPITWISLGTSQSGFSHVLIIEATASRIRPTPRSASAHSLLRSCVVSVTVDKSGHEQVRVLLAIGRPLAWPKRLILMNFVYGYVSYFTLVSCGQFRERERHSAKRLRNGSKRVTLNVP